MNLKFFKSNLRSIETIKTKTKPEEKLKTVRWSACPEEEKKRRWKQKLREAKKKKKIYRRRRREKPHHYTPKWKPDSSFVMVCFFGFSICDYFQKSTIRSVFSTRDFYPIKRNTDTSRFCFLVPISRESKGIFKKENEKLRNFL